MGYSRGVNRILYNLQCLSDSLIFLTNKKQGFSCTCWFIEFSFWTLRLHLPKCRHVVIYWFFKLILINCNKRVLNYKFWDIRKWMSKFRFQGIKIISFELNKIYLQYQVCFSCYLNITSCNLVNITSYLKYIVCGSSKIYVHFGWNYF